MADPKSEKIAAGLKLLKKYQKNKEHVPETKSPQRTTPVQEEEPPEIMSIGSLPPAKTFFDSPQSFQSNQTHYQTPDYTSSPASSFFTIPTPEQNTNFFDSLHEPVNTPNLQSVPFNHNYPPVQLPCPPDPGRISELETENSQLKENVALERKINVELQSQVKKAQEHIMQLENELRNSSASQNLEKIAQMEEKIVLQAQSIEILVSEKTDLQQRIERLEEESKSKAAQCDDMAGRLRTFRSHVAQLEREVAEHQEARQQHNTILKKLEKSVQDRNAEMSALRENLAEKDMELVEVRRRLEAAFGEISELQKQLQEKESRLSLAQIKMQQLGSGENPEITSDLPVDEMKKEVDSLKGKVQDLMQEKDRSAHQYQAYINDLNTQLQELQGKHESTLVDLDALKAREESLIAHISDLEKRLQTQSQPPASPVSDSPEIQFFQSQNEELKKEIDDLKERLDSKSIELEKVHEELETARLQGRELEERLEEAQSNCPDAKLLQAAMESDKVAASRALAQNTSLKEKLTEMQQEFIRLSNNKLEIMEQLEKEQSCTAHLRDEVSKLRKISVTEERSTQLGQGVLVDGCTQTTYHDMGAMSPTDPVSPEAVILLQEKFRKTMDELAELSDEKSRLEHQVMQLQGETETIGEYIALYQRQRSLLQKRATEKDQQVALLSQEREELRKKLSELGALVPQLVGNGDPQVNGVEEKSPEKTEAARKIQTLWKEIGSSSLVMESSDPPTMAPCPLCSGRLITV